MVQHESESTPFLHPDHKILAGCTHSHHHLSPPDRPAAALWRRLAGPVIAFVLAIGTFVIATGGAGRVVLPGIADSLPEFRAISRKTWECGTSTLPVLNSTDVVSYFTLEEGEGAVYGTKEHEVVYNGYLFRFVSANNKALFEESPLDYMPAWGGFCAWGIAREAYWTKENLGPDTDPNSWLISDDNVLYMFRSETPKRFFNEDIAGNINAGNERWQVWWGDGAIPGADATGAPLDTDCICNTDICIDRYW